MKRKNPLTYVRTERRRWALTQKEVAALLGFEDRGCISRIELGKQLPSLESALALEVLFGVALKTLFPTLYAETEEILMRRAVPLYEATLQSSTLRGWRKRQLLDSTMKRVAHPSQTKGV